MKTPFWKMHGAGNDFILVDDRKGNFPSTDRDWLSRIAARRTGIGCEGIILIQSDPDADFRMRFFNPDGGEVEMCGNGARCVAKLAHDLGVASASMRFNTIAGEIRADIGKSGVRLHMTPPRDWRMDRALVAAERAIEYSFVNTGVPHVVIETPAVADVDVQSLGAAIRYHEDFAPAGTNANFIEVASPQSLRVRTYERGVEGETLACGTGMVACGLIAGRRGRVSPPVSITCASGDTLEVDYTLTADGAQNVTLLGPAEYVFTGVVDAPG